MRNANEKYIEYARVIQMCKGTKFEDEPWKCIRSLDGTDQYTNNPQFGNIRDLEFAVAILENEPLFMGDKVYWKHDGKEFNWDKGSITIDSWDNWVTRIPPKRTFTLNGVELPCPSLINTNGYLSCFMGTEFYFNSENDRIKVLNAIHQLLLDAAK